MSTIASHRKVALTIHTRRYEVAASIFDHVYDDPFIPHAVTAEEETMMGILSVSDEEGKDRYFVKPANHAVLRALQTMESCEDIDEYEMYTEAELTTAPDPTYENGIDTPATVTIAYDESVVTGMDNTTTTLTWRTDDPGLLTMLREGELSTAMTFRAHHRVTCVYETPYMPFDIAIHALTVDNRLLTDGILHLDYIIELRGAAGERCEMTVKLKDLCK